MRALLLVMLVASLAHADPWSASCPVAMQNGLCVRFGRAASTACGGARGAPPLSRWIAVPRDSALVKKAAAKMTKQEAELARADRDFEALIADVLPKLHFGRPAASQRSTDRFQRWLRRQQDGMTDLAKRYRALGALGRVAQLSQMMAQHLLTSPVPHDLTRGEFAQERRDAYCDEVLRMTEPLLARALEGFAACAAVEPANRWNAMCVRELERIDPVTFPPMREKLPKPSVTGGIDIALEGKPEQ